MFYPTLAAGQSALIGELRCLSEVVLEGCQNPQHKYPTAKAENHFRKLIP